MTLIQHRCKKAASILVLAASVAALPAAASDFAGGYVGAGAGIGRDKLSGNLSSESKNALAGGVEAGYNWDIADTNWLLGIDGFYDRTKSKSRSVTDNLTGLSSNLSFGDKRYGIDGKVGYAMEKWLPYAKLGIGRLKGTDDLSGYGTNALHMALGTEYKIADQWSLGGELGRMRGKEDNGTKGTNTSLLLTLKYYFNKALPVAAAAPVVAAAPEPTPIAEPAPAPAKVCSENLTLPGTVFDYDKATLKDNAELQKFGEKLRAGTYSAVKVTGYTDRLGSDAYNNALSQQRADTVKKALSAYVSESIITAEGRGKANPVTTSCKGNKKTKALIACLAPDRRVEIEATGACR